MMTHPIPLFHRNLDSVRISGVDIGWDFPLGNFPKLLCYFATMLRTGFRYIQESILISLSSCEKYINQKIQRSDLSIEV